MDIWGELCAPCLYFVRTIELHDSPHFQFIQDQFLSKPNGRRFMKLSCGIILCLTGCFYNAWEFCHMKIE